ncbi:MAG: hypothetical protein HF973_15615 [Chloroflexi bacterium]|nr:hypothetical protein [Chloroflexota bacterium]
MDKLAGLFIWLGTAIAAAVTAVAIFTHTVHWGLESFLLMVVGTVLVLALGALAYSRLGEE